MKSVSKQPREQDGPVDDAEQVTVTMPRSTLAQLQEAVTSAAPTRLSREETRRRLEERRGGKPLPEHALAWARAALGVDEGATGRQPGSVVT